MKDHKIKFRYFTIVEWEKEQNFLRQEGLKGWRFTKATLLGIYHFEKCEPEDVVYQLDYNPDGIAHKVTGLLTKNNMSRCLRTAAGSISRIISATVISGSRLQKWPEMKRSSAMTNPDWRW